MTTYLNYKGQTISAIEAIGEQWNGRAVMDMFGNPITLDESSLLPKLPVVNTAGGGVSVKTGANVAALGAANDGDLGFLRVGTWPDVEYVELARDGSAGKWVSKPHALVAMSDEAYMGVNTTVYSYISTSQSGTTTGAIGWSTRPIRRAAELFALGLSLQIHVSGIIAGTSAPATVTMMPFFFQNDDNEAVVFSSDGSTAVGFAGTPLVSPATTTPTFRATGWQDMLKNGTANPLASADVTKRNLWPRLYAKVSAGTSYGSIIDVDVQYRWVG